MPISDRLRGGGAVALIAAALLAACDPVSTGGLTPLDREVPRLAREASALRSAELRLPSGAVRIAVPTGSCIAPDSVRIDRQVATLLAGDCRAVVVSPPPARAMPALLTATVSDAPLPGDGAPAERAAALESALHAETGERLLADIGPRATLIGTRRSDDTVYAFIDTGEGGASPLFSTRIWRAFSQERGHMIVLSGRTEILGDAASLALFDRVRAFRAATRAANRRG